jgi:hypothetical protein
MVDGVHSADEFVRRNQVSFVTFNYDRSLEARLFTKIQYSFGLDYETALKAFTNIPIVHMYGALGGFPIEGHEPVNAWIQAARCLRTIFDAQHDAAVVRQAKELLGEARHICCLGFGFHKENVDLIDLAGIASRFRGTIASSRFGITDQEWNRVMRPFAKVGVQLHAALPVDRCLDAMRELPIF